jgi:adenylate cyclase
VPETGLRHPVDACLTALEMQATAARIKSRNDKMRLPSLELRVGIHTGPVISGVVGNHRFTFDIWGDAVNTASLMEAHCLPGRINVSDTVAGHARYSNSSRGVLSKPSTNARTKCSSSIA